MTKKHKVFLSYHHKIDEKYRNKFEELFGNNFVSKSVDEGDIDTTNIKTEAIRQDIRDKYLSDTSVTVVLIGKETWKRKHIDWEISSSIRKTANSPRSGLIGILLPTYPMLEPNTYGPHTIPPRLYSNIKCGYAKIYNWTANSSKIETWIHEAFLRRNKINPDNSYPMFKNNRSGTQWQ